MPYQTQIDHWTRTRTQGMPITNIDDAATVVHCHHEASTNCVRNLSSDRAETRNSAIEASKAGRLPPLFVRNPTG